MLKRCCRAISLIIILVVMCSLGGCEGADEEIINDTTRDSVPNITKGSMPRSGATAPRLSSVPTLGSGDVTAPNSIPQEPPLHIDWKHSYLSFIEDNYALLTESCVGGMAGAGFIDLDLDCLPELLIFDYGASAAMGVQFFDIIDGKVECVSANMLAIGENFGRDNLVPAFVNTGLFENFRMFENRDTGEYFFAVESSNGALDFIYRELIVFGSSDGILTLRSVLYEYLEFDPESGEVVSARYEKDGQLVDAEEHERAYSEFAAPLVDTGYNAVGTFVWEDRSYADNQQGFAALFEHSLKLYDDAH